ncbi:MAG: hypothetical protein JWO78_2462 [Micavibrio sp.]|nr:hypothetical protein [Micavibrio sp.]
MKTGQNGSDDGSGGSITIFQQAHCRFAYTLNNRQPVRCSIIGDQPLFFMDFEGDVADEFAEEDMNDPFGINAIEQSVADLKEKIMGFEPSTGLSELAELRLANFVDESMEIIGESLIPKRDHSFQLKTLEKALRESRFVASLLDTAKTHNINLAFSAQVEQAFYDREARTVFLNPVRDVTDQVLLAIRELRRVWQHKNGALLHPLTFHPDQAILINRAQHADLSVAMIRGAWELQLAGNKDAWERLEVSAFEDLARAFAREAYLDFRTINDGQAASAVFEAWFLSDRCRHEDRALIQAMLSDYQGYVFDNEQASKSVSADLIMALGTMPFGKNYLSPFVATVISDPLFTEIRDRSNANFLWFIKFERSFRETEQELQTSSPNKDRQSDGSSITKIMDGDDNGKKSTVLALPGRKDGPLTNLAKLPAAARAAGLNADDAGSAAGNVLYIDAFTKRLGNRG